MEISENEGPFPSFCMLDLSEDHNGIKYVFMYNSVRFYINIRDQELEGEGELLDKFNDFRENIDDSETMFQFEEWILKAMNDFEARTSKPITLLDYFAPPTYAFRLLDRDGDLCAIQENYDPQTHGDSSPRTWIVDTLPDTKRDSRNRCCVLRSVLPSVPSVLASSLERVNSAVRDEEMSDVPQKVRRVGSSDEFFFKPGFKYHGHLRELDLLSQINDSGIFQPPFRTSKLIGLVIWDDDSSVLMGFLLEYIEGKTLAERMGDASVQAKRKWIEQIEATIKQLHRNGIVWGDIKPDNIIINTDEDAVAIDFGGGYTSEYIEASLQQTQQGDMMALSRMKEELGI